MSKIRRSASIQDVATRAEVSAMTVSRVLNSPDRVAPETRQRVERVIRELGYVPNALATGLFQGRTKTIALIVSDITNPFYTTIVRGVEDLAQRNGYTVIIGNSDESVEKERAYLTAMMSKRIDGLIITPASTASRKMLALLQKRGSPFVLIDRDIEGVSADVVAGDSIGGARMLTEHLIKLGHRRIAILNGPIDVPTSRDRMRGYKETLREYGIESRPELMIEGNYRREESHRSVHQLLQLPVDQRPTAIFACNNMLALSAIEALREAHVAVPDEMAVVCFDDIELATTLNPFLTVVAQPARSFGTVATQFLLERLEGQADLQPRKVILTSELIVRQSCGATRKLSSL